VCLPLLIFPCTMKSGSSLLAPAHPGGPGKRAIKRLWCGVVIFCAGLFAEGESRGMKRKHDDEENADDA